MKERASQALPAASEAFPADSESLPALSEALTDPYESLGGKYCPLQNNNIMTDRLKVTGFMPNNIATHMT